MFFPDLDFFSLTGIFLQIFSPCFFRRTLHSLTLLPFSLFFPLLPSFSHCFPLSLFISHHFPSFFLYPLLIVIPLADFFPLFFSGADFSPLLSSANWAEYIPLKNIETLQ